MGDTIKREQYTSDYVLGDPTFNSSPFQKYDETIAKLEETNLNLEILRDYPGQTEEMKAKIQEVIDNVNYYIKEFAEIRFKRYEEGIYKRQWYSFGFPIKKNVQFIKRVEGNSCENCVFNYMPCRNINSHYGCYKTLEYSPNNETRNGELIKSGHFIEIEPIKTELINNIEK